MNWVLFNGAMVYLDRATQTRIIELKGLIKNPKQDHIPNFTPKAPTFGLAEVNACVYKTKGKKNENIEVANWNKLVIT